MTLEEYVSHCALYADDEIPEGATSREVSEELARSIEVMESIDPPPEVADYHNKTLAYGKALKRVVDAQPEDEEPNILAFLILVPQGLAVEDAMNNLDHEVRRQLAAVGCAAEGEAPELESPGNVRFAVEGSTIRVSWDGVDGADYYTVYHGERGCRVLPRGGTIGCEQLASNIAETAYTHAQPHPDRNSYWVASCDSSRCSRISTAEPAGEGPDAPRNPRYSRDRATAVVSWDASEGATHYKVYYTRFEDPECFLANSGGPLGCWELDGNVVATTYIHERPDPDLNYFWVVACNIAGCSEIDSTNPARPVAARPDTPSNVRYTMEGSTIRISWDAVDGADHYAVFHDTFFDSSCSLGGDGDPRFCDELAADLVETAYVHTSPGVRNNYYWVIACNRGGCSEVDSDNPARSR